jgi:esterase/lipase superfamily enzyme
VKRDYHKWWSPRLEREMELLVFGHGGTRVLVFPTRCGRFFDYENFGLVDALRPRLEAGHLQLYCIDSVDQESLYCDWVPPWDRIRRHQRYEEYVLCEVMPLSAQLNGHAPLIAHGCSLGGFHAINLALRHPHWFVKAVSLSGRFDLTQQVDDFRDLLDGHREDLVYFHTPNAYVAHAHDPGQLDALRRLEVVLAVGETDPFCEQNRYLAHALGERGVRRALHVWAGRAHTPRRWAKMADLYL